MYRIKDIVRIVKDYEYVKMLENYKPSRLIKDYLHEKKAQLRSDVRRRVEERELTVHLKMNIGEFIEDGKMRWRINDE